MYAILSLAHDVGLAYGSLCGNSHHTRFPNSMGLFLSAASTTPAGVVVFFLLAC